MRIKNRKMISIRFPEDILNLINVYAKKNNISKTEFIIQSIKERIHREDLTKAIK